MSKVYDLRNGSINKLFAHYAYLSVIGLGAMSINTVLDGVFVGHGVGSIGLACVNLVLFIYPLLIGVGMCYGYGAGALIAISFGENDDQKANYTFNIALIGAVVTAIISSLLLVIFAGGIVNLLGATEGLREGSTVYLRTFSIFGGFFVMVLFFEPIIRNDGDPKRVMYSLIMGAAFNAVLNYIFILKLGWGLFGAAFATGLAQVFSFVYLFAHFLKKRGKLHLMKVKFEGTELVRILRTGAPVFTTQFCQAIFIIVYNRVILHYIGEAGITINGVIQYLYEVIMLCNIGFGEAVQPISSYNLGAQQYDRMRKVYYTAIRSGFVFAAILTILFFTVPQIFIGIFTTEKDVIEAAIPAVQMYYSAMLLSSFNMITIYYLQSVRRSEEATILTLMRNLGCFLIVISFLPRLIGENGIWLTFPAAEVLSLCITGVMIYRNRFYFKKKKTVHDDQQLP